MHELGLCDGIVAAALKRAGDRRIRAVKVRVTGHPVDPAVIEQGFRLAAAGTLAADATVELVQDQAEVRCRTCGAEERADGALGLAACVRCGGLDVEVTGREEAFLEAITVDQTDGHDEPAATGG
ncbi:hydrogenase/urease maturation nickel metallochaperone HypA [Actinocorallia sp. A-T 12471]|uniref:hydrogenase/urease maturation nickel metallochaperone HypA n=1 Tax=Actinocorallia sp. A-T 12471 TaxID=3089813 RepID=UPI0029CF6EFD|nr:hydrogenase/urease maturation nickel metallochaperone HypA [Actinocorallia sp. A-T 12471]MDX6739947.1 hydrogenase/urease maturation nickel metallochaperone HypA [Actinocorallia sp. A-T 12471]